MARLRSAVLTPGALVLAACACVVPVPPIDGPVGKFDSRVRAQWRIDGRSMVLLQPLVFRDLQQQMVWIAHKGALIDGASIPQFFWSAIGGPYEGLYRDASVNHDYECCVKLRPWRMVHRMFYYGMIANGVDKSLALWMYWAVFYFGPRWHLPEESAAEAAEVEAPRKSMTEGDARVAKALFEAPSGLSLDEVEQLDAPAIRARFATLIPSPEVGQAANDNRVIPFAEKLPPCVEVLVR